METKYMSQQDQIILQDVKIANQNYSISWLASAYHADIFVCIKSSWLSYDEFIEILKEKEEKDIDLYCDNRVFWQKVTRQKSLQVSTNKVKPPADVILLPIANNSVLIPKDENEFVNLQKTIKGIIRYTKERKAPLYSFNADESISFLNDAVPLPKEEIVAEYIVDGLRYPVTVEMLGKKINVHIPRKSTCEPYITEDLNGKYYLVKVEE